MTKVVSEMVNGEMITSVTSGGFTSIAKGATVTVQVGNGNALVIMPNGAIVSREFDTVLGKPKPTVGMYGDGIGLKDY